MQLSQAYQTLVDNKEIEFDAFQLQSLEILQSVVETSLLSQTGFLSRFSKPKPKSLGVYLWGGVGRGKTWVMDFFFDNLPIEKKLRIHYHAFIQGIQSKLSHYNHEKDPMDLVVKSLDIKILCLDEFIVDDIGDAMVLSSLLAALFKNKIVLITTSNIIPDKLYQYGLQRERFLPAIDRINTNMQVFFLNHESDYRMKIATNQSHSLAHYFAQSAGLKIATEVCLNNYKLTFLRAASPVLWTKFANLCDVPLGKNEYLSLAQQYKIILLADTLPMDEWQNDTAKRFVTLVDVFYDQNQWVILPPELDINKLYTGKQLAFEFKRITSRLHEMKRTLVSALGSSDE